MFCLTVTLECDLFRPEKIKTKSKSGEISYLIYKYTNESFLLTFWMDVTKKLFCFTGDNLLIHLSQLQTRTAGKRLTWPKDLCRYDLRSNRFQLFLGHNSYTGWFFKVWFLQFFLPHLLLSLQCEVRESGCTF